MWNHLSMNSENEWLAKEKVEERRLERGTGLWVRLNILLFPIPSHFSLLRVREFSLAQSFLHIGITFLLFFILIGSAFLQIPFPSIGRLWMLLPIFSGFVIMFRYRSSIARFQSFDLVTEFKKNISSLLCLFFFFTILNIIPQLDFIEFQNKSKTPLPDWIGDIPNWQSIAIFMLGIFGT